MPSTFAYRVRDRQGALLNGEIVADSQDLVLSRLRELGYVPLEVKEKGRGLQREFSLRPGYVKLKHLAVFSRQFSTMINSGLPLLRALAVLEQQAGTKVLAKILSETRVDVEKGSSLSAALAKHPRAFSKLYVAMVRSGEAGGVLDSVLLRLADTLEREVSLRRKIRSAMTYPIVVLFFVLAILTAMLVFVVPTFKDLYSTLGGQLPAMTRALLAISDTVKNQFIFVALGVAAVVGAFLWWKRTERGRVIWDRFKLKIPVFGSLLHKTALSRFARTLAALSRSGVPILQALDIVADTVNNTLVARAVTDVQESVKGGESLSRPLSKHQVFPPMVVQMMTVGEETGALDEMLEKISEFYDQEVESTVEQLTSLIEPVLIVIVGGLVGVMVIALYLPMFKVFELIE